MNSSQKASEGSRTESGVILDKQNQYLKWWHPYPLVLVSIGFVGLTYHASLQPGFSQLGLLLIGAAAVAATSLSCAVFIHMNRSWRLGLQSIINRPALDHIPVDIEALVSIVTARISDSVEKAVDAKLSVKTLPVSEPLPASSDSQRDDEKKEED